jgi:hypothetical protein
MVNIGEAGVRKRKKLNSQCIKQIGICEKDNRLDGRPPHPENLDLLALASRRCTTDAMDVRVGGKNQ